MRILMISDVYFPRINGVSTSIQTFKEELESLGHHVVLIAPEYPQIPQDSDPDPSIFRIPSRQVIFDPEDRMMRMKDILALTEVLRAEQFDLIHVHTPFVAHYAGRKLARALDLPLALTYHTLFEEYFYHYIPFLPRTLLKGVARYFSRTQCNDAAAIVAPSTIIVDVLQKYGVSQPIEIVPTGIRCERFQHGDGQRFRQQFNIDDDRKVLLNVSRVAFEKNIGLLLEMVNKVRQEVPEVCLVIAGEGPAKKSYIKQSAQLGLDGHIRFVGYLDRSSALIDCYSSADYFVFSSVTETQGLVLLEAMAAGTPVVSVAAMGTKDILEDCAAAQIVDNDAEQFARTVIALLRSDDQQLKLACKASAAKWDSTFLAEKLAAFYANILDGSAAQQKQAFGSANSLDEQEPARES